MISCSISGERALRIHRDDDGAEPEHGEVALDEAGAVATQQGYAIAAADAELGQPATDAGHTIVQLAVGRLDAAVDDRHMIGFVSLDEAGKIHRGAAALYRRSSEMTPAVRINSSRRAKVSVVAGRMTQT